MPTLNPQTLFLATDAVCVAMVLVLVRIGWLISVSEQATDAQPATQPVAGVRRHTRAGGYWPTEPWRRS